MGIRINTVDHHMNNVDINDFLFVSRSQLQIMGMVYREGEVLQKAEARPNTRGSHTGPTLMATGWLKASGMNTERSIGKNPLGFVQVSLG